MREFFEGLGLSSEVQEKVVRDLTKDKDNRVNFIYYGQYDLQSFLIFGM